jgi:hypothetical protein
MEKPRVGPLHDAVAGVSHPHRLGDPAEFAPLVMDIINNSMINGAVIRIDAANAHSLVTIKSISTQ